MKYTELLEKIQSQKETPIKTTDIAEVLGVSKQTMHKRINGAKGDIPENEIKLLERAFDVTLQEDTITIDHIHIKPSCGHGTVVLDEPEITPIQLGTSLIQRILKVTHPQNLKTFTATGDSMEPIIEDGDLLLVDTGRTDFNNGGVFILTINNDLYVKRLRLSIAGELDIISDNSKYPIESLKPSDTIEIVVKGRVIKNLSRGL